MSRGGKGRARRTFWTIVHPTDFSDCSDVALRVARALACDHGARLILLHVVSVIEVPHLDEPATVEDPEICRQTLEGMCECLDDADLKYPVTPLLKLGQSAVEILRTADETGCDLLVMGTHGRTGLGRLLMGSVAEQVLRRAALSRPVDQGRRPDVIHGGTRPRRGSVRHSGRIAGMLLKWVVLAAETAAGLAVPAIPAVVAGLHRGRR